MKNENSVFPYLRRIVNAIIVALALLLSVKLGGVQLDGYYIALAIIAFFLAGYIFEDMKPASNCSRSRIWSGLASIVFAWLMVVGWVVFLGYLTRLGDHFDLAVIRIWFTLAPVLLIGAHLLVHTYTRNLYTSGKARRAAVVGGNALGVRLAEHISRHECLLNEFVGFVDDRAIERLDPVAQQRYLGKVDALTEFVGQNRLDIVYICLPISQRERITRVEQLLKDSTASIYLVPDIYTFDLIRARIDQVGNMPVIAVLETPFTGIDGLNKRLSDLVLATLILVLVSPLMLLIALGVKLSSPGPVIFKQRRYGFNGEEIVVYKFRSMRVCEDGPVIRQATQSDDRVTPLGRFLRKTSLDELPQFFNVLQGRMSIVGPRPHAVAHNETYRQVISGYMLRHKARPGITGWAQVNGFRGETETVEKMSARVQHDLDYLRGWSLVFDLLIIFRTVWLVVKDARAY